jgi:hypothetical protein
MTERRLARMMGALSAAAALAQPAYAEGGLPGSPAAVRPGAAVAPAAAPAPPESLGGAIFNPFAAPASAANARRTAHGYSPRSGATAPTTTNSPGTR